MTLLQHELRRWLLIFSGQKTCFDEMQGRTRTRHASADDGRRREAAMPLEAT